MKGGRGSYGAATDLLVCFPSRAHLALMPPKAICSPSRPSASEPVKRRHSTSRAGPPPSSTALFKAAASARNSSRRTADVPVDDEPSSPKVTCAGQIKARRPAAKPKSASGGAGGATKAAKKATWLQALGIKKDALPFLNAVHGAFRLNVAGCFGSFPGAVVEYTSEEDDEEEEEELAAGKDTKHGAALAKWFMVLEEGKKVSSRKREQQSQNQEEEQDKEADVAPPANALMLMRCRSAPAKGLPRRLRGDSEEEMINNAKKEEEEEEERLVLMSYAPDFFNVSVDIAKETWIVGGDDAVLRCRSWKR